MIFVLTYTGRVTYYCDASAADAVDEGYRQACAVKTGDPSDVPALSRKPTSVPFRIDFGCPLLFGELDITFSAMGIDFVMAARQAELFREALKAKRPTPRKMEPDGPAFPAPGEEYVIPDCESFGIDSSVQHVFSKPLCRAIEAELDRLLPSDMYFYRRAHRDSRGATPL